MRRYLLSSAGRPAVPTHWQYVPYLHTSVYYAVRRERLFTCLRYLSKKAGRIGDDVLLRREADGFV